MTHYLLQMLLLIDKGHLPLQKGQLLFQGIKKFCWQMYLQKMRYPIQSKYHSFQILFRLFMMMLSISTYIYFLLRKIMIFSWFDNGELDAAYSKWVLTTLSVFINIAFFIDVHNDNNRVSFLITWHILPCINSTLQNV